MRDLQLLHKVVLSVALLLFQQAATGQVLIKGTAYDRTVRFGMPGVSVIGTSGAGTVTDAAGHYSINLPSGDSLSFSYLGKATRKFPVKDIPLNQAFDISLEVVIDSLPTVFVHQSIYRLDSLANRNEYRKIFGYEPDYFTNANSGRNGVGVGVGLDMLLSAKKIRRMESLRRRLEQEERDKYVDHRFTRGLVRRITGLQSPALDTFMVLYRPGYETLVSFETEYEYYRYIRDRAEYFSDTWRKDHPVNP